jgi:hypothetical protein
MESKRSKSVPPSPRICVWTLLRSPSGERELLQLRPPVTVTGTDDRKWSATYYLRRYRDGRVRRRAEPSR